MVTGVRSGHGGPPGRPTGKGEGQGASPSRASGWGPSMTGPTARHHILYWVYHWVYYSYP